MSTQALFLALQNSEIGIGMGQANRLFGIAAQLFHITGLIFILSSILLVNLRLLGVGLVNQPVGLLVKKTNGLIWFGLAFLFLSGFFMFAPSAGLYYPNPAFWLKFQLLAAALVVQFTLYKKVTATETPNPYLAKSVAVISIALWFAVGLAGRAIGFVAA
ncbi:hypothetical protein GCM10011613_15720 [Cellvibrio zantedeschiae]|uniref:DUF6644 domain-containing protein n=1 Tax=Cellvibrio zantedeschiae TaxID=1237077 RepID=A0ABQ3B2K1_9GAMM|nr:DUF6644 family protein [Cellvibrio zantedeschiae]GGY71716.1 hypothetical protein GCM10011613_15720 [Cellvibrio zantedeschiae]